MMSAVRYDGLLDLGLSRDYRRDSRSVESCNKTLQCLGFTQVKSLVY
ncbi:MAG UNVERIFIED_CONTAM: hypothetical protein LVR29_10880 [Microcystis novacekii LVE1205-3]